MMLKNTAEYARTILQKHCTLARYKAGRRNMPRVSKSLRDIQHTIAKEVVLRNELPIENIKTIVAFDCATLGSKIVCAAIVVEFPSMKILEKQHLVKTAPMPYVPGYLSFREGPLILELAYKLE